MNFGLSGINRVSCDGSSATEKAGYPSKTKRSEMDCLRVGLFRKLQERCVLLGEIGIDAIRINAPMIVQNA